MRRLETPWFDRNRGYAYALRRTGGKRRWFMMARFIDETVDQLLLERLRATTIDAEAWQKAVMSSQAGARGDARRLQNAAEQAQRGHPGLAAQPS